MHTTDVVIPSHARGDGSWAALAQAGARYSLWSPGGLPRCGTGTHPARHKAAREKGGQKPSRGIGMVTRCSWAPFVPEEALGTGDDVL